jgi:hypothetical protein
MHNRMEMACTSRSCKNVCNDIFIYIYIYTYLHAHLYITLTSSMACVLGRSVTMSSTDFSFQNLEFWNLFELSVKKSFNIHELLHHNPIWQMSWNRAFHAPLLVESFPKTPITQSEALQFNGSHMYKSNQNKLPSFIHRFPDLFSEITCILMTFY